MEKALQEIAAIKKAVEGVGGDVEQPEEPIEEEWPEWYAWDGVTLNPWQKDSKCTHNGARYISLSLIHISRLRKVYGNR